MPHPGPGDFLCGFAERDITPHPGFPLAGFSTEAQTGDGVRGHLFARALYLCDTTGQDLALIVVDLMSATRVLLESVAQHTVTTARLGIDRLFLHGTHTHTGPAWFYGNTLYDTFVTKTAGFDRGLVDWFAVRIAEAVADAKKSARKGGVVVDHAARIWGMSRNRSRAPFLENPEAATWNSTGPGAGAPALTPDELAVDPRMAVITATHDRGMGVFAFFGNHPTTLGHKLRFYGADWPGEAARIARTQLHHRLGRDAIVAVGIKATGDVNGYRYDLTPFEEPGAGLEARVGSAVGESIANAVIRSHASAKPEPIQIWFAEPRINDPNVPTTPATKLADQWSFGSATVGGSEESRSVFHVLGLAREGRHGNTFPPDNPQHPKTARALRIVQAVLDGLFGLDAPAVQPLTAMRIGKTLFAGLPGEPTITASYQLECALRGGDLEHVVVVPCTGDYGGYFATTPEYELQHYEGASTLWGRYSVPYLQARVTTLVSRPPAPAQAGTIEFTTRDDRRRFVASDDLKDISNPRPLLTLNGRVVSVRWWLRDGARVVFANNWWVRVEQHDNAQWAPVTYGGRQLDDANYPILIQRNPDCLVDLDRTEQWGLEFEMPGDLPRGRYRIVLARRSGFAGFTSEFTL